MNSDLFCELFSTSYLAKIAGHFSVFLTSYRSRSPTRVLLLTLQNWTHCYTWMLLTGNVAWSTELLVGFGYGANSKRPVSGGFFMGWVCLNITDYYIKLLQDHYSIPHTQTTMCYSSRIIRLPKFAEYSGNIQH